MTIHISEFTDKDLPTIVELLNEEYKSSYEFIPFTERVVLSQMRERSLRILVAEENGNLLGLIGTHIHAEEQLETHVSWLAACEGSKRKTVEDELVNAVEKEAMGSAVSTMIDEGSPRVNDWLDRGYVLCPGYQRMSATLNGLKPIPKLDEHINLRNLRTGEEAKLVKVINAGFGWQRLEAGIIEIWKSEDPEFSEDWVQVADINEKIVSAVVAKPDTDYVRYLHLKRGYLGPAATLPEFRNKHIGSALTARAMNFLFEKGMNSVRLGTSEQNASSIALLQSLGFQVDIIRKTLRKNLHT